MWTSGLWFWVRKVNGIFLKRRNIWQILFHICNKLLEKQLLHYSGLRWIIIKILEIDGKVHFPKASFPYRKSHLCIDHSNLGYRAFDSYLEPAAGQSNANLGWLIPFRFLKKILLKELATLSVVKINIFFHKKPAFTNFCKTKVYTEWPI